MKIISSPLFAAAAMIGIISSVYAGGDAKNDMIKIEKKSDGRWEVHAGFGIRQSFDFNVSSSSRDLLGSALSPTSGAASPLAGIGPANREANRAYDDGFVNIGSEFNLTTNWGYENASQVRQSSQAWNSTGNQSLYLTRSFGPTVSQSPVTGSSSFTDSENEIFPYLEVRRWWECDEESFWQEKGLVVSWSWIPAQAGLMESWEQRTQTQQVTVVDEFFLYGVIPPSAPYSGPELPPGPILDNIPQDRQENTTSSNTVEVVRADVDVDLEMHALSFGGAWRFAPKAARGAFNLIGLGGLDVQAGATINFVQLDLSSNTTVSKQGVLLGSFQESNSTSKVMPGLYVSLGAKFDIGKSNDWFIFTQGRYDYVGTLDVATSSAAAEVDIQGFSLSIGLGRAW
jgi:hypothetical protein